MKKLASIFTVAVASMMISSFAYADVKIGIVDMNLVFKKSSLLISMNDKLTKKFKPRQDEVNAAKKQLQDEVDQLNLNNATMSTDDRTKLQEKIITDKANVDILAASFERDLTLAKNKDLQTFTSKLSDAISKVAQEGNYDIIEQRSNLTYVNTKLDITQPILDQIK